MLLIDTTITGTDGQQHHLIVSQTMGSGGSYHVMIDGYYKGQIVLYNPGGWTWTAETDLLTSDDIGAIMDIVTEQNKD